MAATVGPYAGTISTTGAGSGSWNFPLPSGYGVLFIEVAGEDASGNFTCGAKSVGFKNIGGTVTMYGNSLTNLLGSPLCDLALSLASFSVAGGTNVGTVTATGVAGSNINWTVFVNMKNASA